MPEPAPTKATAVGFVTTRWSWVDHLRSGDEPQRLLARAQLSNAYWPAVYAHLRRRGYSSEDAADITQSFFADVVLGRDLLESARRERGRLRAIVLTALKRYCIDGMRRKAARGGTPLSLTPEILEREDQMITDAGDPDTAFDRRWAAIAVGEALARCEAHCVAGNKERHWRAFEARVVGPALRATTPPPLATLAERLGFGTAAGVAAAIQTVKRVFESMLREQAAATGGCEDADQEYESLVGALSNGHGAAHR